jgi:tRNA 2-selenouridine synthase
MLWEEWKNAGRENPVWLEDESRNIGTVFLPDGFYDHIRSSPCIILMMSVEKRLPRLIEEYSYYPKDQLAESVNRISKRIGGDNTRDALAAIEAGDFAKAIGITLKYYDKAYLYSISKNHTGQVIYVETNTDDIEENSSKVIEASKQIIRRS